MLMKYKCFLAPSFPHSQKHSPFYTDNQGWSDISLQCSKIVPMHCPTVLLIATQNSDLQATQQADAIFPVVVVLSLPTKCLTLFRFLQSTLPEHQTGKNKFLANKKIYFGVKRKDTREFYPPKEASTPFITWLSPAPFFSCPSGTPLSSRNAAQLCIVRDPISLFISSSHHALLHIYTTVR